MASISLVIQRFLWVIIWNKCEIGMKTRLNRRGTLNVVFRALKMQAIRALKGAFTLSEYSIFGSKSVCFRIKRPKSWGVVSLRERETKIEFHQLTVFIKSFSILRRQKIYRFEHQSFVRVNIILQPPIASSANIIALTKAWHLTHFS